MIVVGLNVDRKGLGDDVVARAAVIDGDGDDGRASGIGHRREGQGAIGVGTGIIDRRIRNQIGIAGGRGDGELLIFVGGTGSDAGQIHRLQAGVFVDGQVVDGIQRRRLIHRIDRHRESPGDDVVARGPVIDSDGDDGGAVGIGHRREGQGAVGVGAGIIDGRIGNQIGIAGRRSDSEHLIFVGGTGRDAVQIHRLQAGIFVDGQVVDGVQRRGLIGGRGIRWNRVRHFVRKRTLDA